MKKSMRKPAQGLTYPAFINLDGVHPWSQIVPEGAVLYPARRLRGGKVSYFNFDLAKEMGLIPGHHAHQLNHELCETLLSTFCLRIINEYDQQSGERFTPSSVKPGTYMATRYLQMQHSDKSGRTSGDGRAIWNGVITHKGKTWDVSSRGTGVTCLAPGSVQAGQPLRSGNTEHGYGCGLAEIDELFAAAILAEIFHRNGISTERVLCIIDLGNGVGIGVRAAPNLLRPAHLFLFLKQGRLAPLQRAVDYFIQRQLSNKIWSPDLSETKSSNYDWFLAEITTSFARFASRLERDYIFTWLEWDGDNMLADAGIIDYGSVRQFGLRHDQYRYDDVDRYSTNLSEQRQKAREIVQTFVQMVDFLKSGKKRAWGHFHKSSWLKKFDRDFERFSLEYFLYQMGFPEPHRRLILRYHLNKVLALFTVHSELEKIKTKKPLKKVADGVHRPAILNMRKALADMAEHLDGLPYELSHTVPSPVLFQWILASHACGADKKLSPRLQRQLELWQKLYIQVVEVASTPETWEKTAGTLALRAMRINNSRRITGNALIHIVDEILRHRRRGLSDGQIQAAIEELIQAQTLNPDYQSLQGSHSKAPHAILRSFFSVVDGFREDI